MKQLLYLLVFVMMFPSQTVFMHPIFYSSASAAALPRYDDAASLLRWFGWAANATTQVVMRCDFNTADLDHLFAEHRYKEILDKLDEYQTAGTLNDNSLDEVSNGIKRWVFTQADQGDFVLLCKAAKICLSLGYVSDKTVSKHRGYIYLRKAQAIYRTVIGNVVSDTTLKKSDLKDLLVCFKQEIDVACEQVQEELGSPQHIYAIHVWLSTLKLDQIKEALIAALTGVTFYNVGSD